MNPHFSVPIDWLIVSEMKIFLKSIPFLVNLYEKYTLIMMCLTELTNKLSTNSHLGNICLNINMTLKANTERKDIISTPLPGFYSRSNWLHTDQINGFLEFYAWNNIK